MPQVAYCICSFCKSLTQNEAYKLNRRNFTNFRFEMIAGDTITPPKMYSGVICNECVVLQPSPISTVLTAMETAKANDAAVQSELNQ